jgi:HD-like signal output (HDOD) protein
MGKRSIEEVFVAGLLHDLGKLVIAHNLPENYQKVLTLSREKNIPLAAPDINAKNQPDIEIPGARERNACIDMSLTT